MRAVRSKTGLVFGGILLGVVLGASVASAVVTQVVLVDRADSYMRIVRSTADASGVQVGWHTHPGPAIVQVEEGRFKIFQGRCRPTVVGPGETYIEIPDVPVRAVAKGEITWTTTLIVPNGVPLATPVDSPCP